MSSLFPLFPPLYLPGQEPLPPGVTTEEGDAYRQSLIYQKWIGYVPESCPFKVVLAGGMGELVWSLSAFGAQHKVWNLC